MNFSVVVEYFPHLLQGTWMSLQLVVLSVVLGGIMALPIALARLSPVLWIRSVPFAYIFFFVARRCCCRFSWFTMVYHSLMLCVRVFFGLFCVSHIGVRLSRLP